MTQSADAIRQMGDASVAFMRGELSSEALAERLDPRIEVLWHDRQTLARAVYGFLTSMSSCAP